VSPHFLVSKHVSQNKTIRIEVDIKLVQVSEMYKRCQSPVTVGMIKILLAKNYLNIKLYVGLIVHA
jgi:hypothetical protein